MRYEIYFDGGCSPCNPGKITIGAVVVKCGSTTIFKDSLLEEHEELMSSNYAEYVGLDLAINWLLENEFVEAKIYGDSDLVIKQMQGKYKIKDGRIYSSKAKEVLNKITSNGLGNKLQFYWISRNYNQEADALTK